MKADLSRSTFQKKKHYRKVNMQQGRVQMDADWNEQNDIQFHHEQSFLRDLIGKSGTLRENDGFKILVNANFGWNDLGDESNPASSSSSLKKFLRENFGLSWIADSLSFKPDGPDSYILSTNTHKATLKRDASSKTASLLLEDDTTPTYVFYYESTDNSLHTKGFIISNGKDGRGNYYVDGILCENEYPVEASRQPDLQALDIRFFLFELPPNDALSDSAKQSIAWFIAEMYSSMTGQLKVEKQGNVITVSGQEDKKVTIKIDNSTVTLDPELDGVTLIAEESKIYYSVSNPSLPKEPGIYLAYLDVWDRHVTHREDSNIREQALDGVDTATRTKTAWQVKLVRLDLDTFPTNQCKLWDSVISDIYENTTGLLRARVEPSEMSQDKCSIYETAGYQRLENQLYRVEVHKSGKLGEATFKWSRDNGIVVSKILEFSPGAEESAIVVETLGSDENLEFKNDSWIEVTDELHESLGIPGTFVKIGKIVGTSITFAMDSIIGAPITKDNFGQNPKARRWESSTSNGPLLLPDSSSGFIKLESGVEVELAKDPHESETYFRSGDYWLIPARTKSGEVEWPKVGDKPEDDSIFMPPPGIAHHYAPLAILERNKETPLFDRIADARNFFSSLTELVQIHYAGGDGQQALPKTKLSMPLRVAVTLGRVPLADLQMRGIAVRFTVISGDGSVTKTLEGKEIDGSMNKVECITNAASGPAASGPDPNFDYSAGVADCIWQLGTFPENQQQVKAELVICGELVQDVSPIYFNATLISGISSDNIAVTGLVELVIPGGSREFIFGRFKHIAEGEREAIPAIILGLDAGRRRAGEVIFMEDYTGSARVFHEHRLLFKAIDIDNTEFSISVQSVSPQTQREFQLTLRWWAIPSREFGGDPQKPSFKDENDLGMGGILLKRGQ